MPAKKRYGKKKAGRRRRYGRRRYRIQRYGATTRNPHRFARYETTDRLIDLTGAGTPNQSFSAHKFAFSALQNVSEFNNLYDSYRIRGVLLELNWTPFDGAAFVPTAETSPVLQYFRDYDDDSTPVEGDFRSRADTKTIRLHANRVHKIYLKPAILTTLYQTALSSGYAPKWGQRIDMAQDDVPHYGLKMWVKSISGVNMGKVSIRCKYYVECFGQR